MPLVSIRAPASGLWRADVGSLAVGDTAADVRQAAGGETSADAAVTLRRRPPPPAMLVVRAPQTIHAWRRGPIVRGTGAAGGTVTVTANGVAAGSATVAGDGSWSIDLAALGAGWWRLVFVQVAGGVTYPAAIRTLAVDAPPSWVTPEATFDLDFRRRRAFIESAPGDFVVLDSASFLSSLTFTRASTAYCFDADGVMRSAAVNVPRFDHDPVSGAPRGILIEGARTNLHTYSNDIAGGAWTRSEVGVNDDAGLSKDGTMNADFVVESVAAAGHYVAGPVHTVTAGTVYTASAFAKSANRSLQIVLSGPRYGSDAWANFDLVNGVVGTVGPAATARIEALGGGWYRCHVTATPTSTGSAATRYQVITGAASAKFQSYTGDGVSGLFLAFVQSEVGAFASSYIATGAAAATRAADVATAAVGGWFNASEGALIAEWMVNRSVAASVRVVQMDDGDNDDAIYIIQDASDIVRGSVLVGGVASINVNLGSVVSGSVDNVALAYGSANFAASRKGGAPGTSLSGSVPTGISTLRLGNSASGAHALFGHLRRVSYIPRRVSNAELQALAA